MGREYEKKVTVTSTTNTPIKSTFFEDFESTIMWSTISSPAGGTGATDSTVAYTNAKSWKIQTKATTPAVGDYAESSRTIPRLQSNKIRMSAYIRPVAAAQSDMKIEVTPGGAVNGITFGIRVDTDADKMYYLNSSNVWTQFSSVGLYDPTASFVLFQLDIDQLNGKYIRAYINDQVINLSGLSGYSNTASQESRSEVLKFRVTNTQTNQSTLYVDAVSVEGIS
jgi:hypothetical protein